MQLNSADGNHEQLLVHNHESRIQLDDTTIADPITGLDLYSEAHFRFLNSCRLHYESTNHFFVHANYDPEVDLQKQEPRDLLWMSINTCMPKRHRCGKTAIVGHTSQKNGNILDRGHLICIDTFCYGGGYLTALDVDSGEIWKTKQGTT